MQFYSKHGYIWVMYALPCIIIKTWIKKLIKIQQLENMQLKYCLLTKTVTLKTIYHTKKKLHVKGEYPIQVWNNEYLVLIHDSVSQNHATQATSLSSFV